MKTPSVVQVTPSQASLWLTRNRTNRPLRSSIVSYYESLIRTGQFKLTHQGIAFDENNNLVDGQHRLKAIEKAGVSVPMMVFKYDKTLSWNSLPIDRGLGRTDAEVMGEDRRIVEMAKMYCNCKDGVQRVSPDRLLEVLNKFGRVNLPYGVKILSTVPFRTAFWIAGRSQEFIDCWMTGKDLCDSLHSLREGYLKYTNSGSGHKNQKERLLRTLYCITNPSLVRIPKDDNLLWNGTKNFFSV